MDRYQTISIIIVDKKPIFKTVRFPDIPLDENDIYVTSQFGDRYDLLADDYYQDTTLYWVISRANTHLNQNSLLIEPGETVRIPANISEIISQYKALNA
jgi:hypothetical protein